MTTVVVNDSDDGDFCGDGYSGGQGRREGGGRQVAPVPQLERGPLKT